MVNQLHVLSVVQFSLLLELGSSSNSRPVMKEHWDLKRLIHNVRFITCLPSGYFQSVGKD